MEQSCCQRRIEWSNPVLCAGLTENSASALARSRPLTDLRRCDSGLRQGFFGLKTNCDSAAIPMASLTEGFFGQNWKLGAKSEFRPRWESEVGIPTLVGERSRNSDLGGLVDRSRGAGLAQTEAAEPALLAAPCLRTSAPLAGRSPGWCSSRRARWTCTARRSGPLLLREIRCP